MSEEQRPKRKDILDTFSDKFPVFQKTYELYEAVGDFSSKEGDTLRKSSEITTLEVLELVVVASRQSKENKVDTLRQASLKLDTLKVFADLAKDMKAVSQKSYDEMQENLQSLGRMIGGWIKAVKV